MVWPSGWSGDVTPFIICVSSLSSCCFGKGIGKRRTKYSCIYTNLRYYVPAVVVIVATDLLSKSAPNAQRIGLPALSSNRIATRPIPTPNRVPSG